MGQSLDEKWSLRDRGVLVTGAAGHIGREMCHTFAERGADIILADLNLSGLQSLAAELEQYKVKTFLHAVDLEDEQQRVGMIRAVKDELSKNRVHLNILINNAAFVGTSSLDGWNVPFEQQSLETWRRAIEVNLTSCFHLCQAFCSDLKRASQKAGKPSNIINIGSIYGHMPPDWSLYKDTGMNNIAAYAASKAGLHGLTVWLTGTLAPDIRVNTIAPGGIARGQDPIFMDRYRNWCAHGEFNTEAQVAQQALFLTLQ